MTDRFAEAAETEIAEGGRGTTGSGEGGSLGGPIRLSQYGRGDFSLSPPDSRDSDGGEAWSSGSVSARPQRRSRSAPTNNYF
jgi:hypothetical protein